MQPSQRFTTEMASAVASFSRAGTVPSAIAASWRPRKPAQVSGIACRRSLVGSRSSRSMSPWRAIVPPGGRIDARISQVSPCVQCGHLARRPLGPKVPLTGGGWRSDGEMVAATRPSLTIRDAALVAVHRHRHSGHDAPAGHDLGLNGHHAVVLAGCPAGDWWASGIRRLFGVGELAGNAPHDHAPAGAIYFHSRHLAPVGAGWAGPKVPSSDSNLSGSGPAFRRRAPWGQGCQPGSGWPVAVQPSERRRGASEAPARRGRWGLRSVAALGGAALALAFPEPGLWWWAYVGLVPVLALVSMAPDRREALWRCWSAGCGFFLVLYHWLMPSLSVFALPLVLATGLGWLPWGLVAWWLLRAPRSAGRAAAAIVAVPSAWVLVEYVRAWEQLGGSWGLLGSTQWQGRSILATAAVGGVWALSFLLG